MTTSAESADILDRLRWRREACLPGSSGYHTMTDAIAEIERLRKRIALLEQWICCCDNAETPDMNCGIHGSDAP
jgi:thiazole synthase ThiGH ThiG subunit